MRTLVTIRRHRDGRLLEERKFRSRSWLLGMMELLYLAHAQIERTAPYELTDILGQPRECDSDHDYRYIRDYKGTLTWVAPGGYGSIFIPTGGLKQSGANEETATWEPLNFLKGDCLGIQIGGDNTPVSPDDHALRQKIFHGQGASVAGPASFSGYTTGDDTIDTIDSPDDMRACILIPERGFRMSSVKLLLYKAGNPGNMVLRIKGLQYDTESGKPYKPDQTGDIDAITENGNTLPVGAPYEWREFTLTTPIDMQPGMCYAFSLECATADAANKVYWRYQDNILPYLQNWYRIYSVDAGDEWSIYDDAAMMIDPQGSAQAEMEYDGCGMYGKTIANPNGEFSIGRLFRNNSGEAITVEEVGLYAAVCKKQFLSYDPICARRAGDAYAACVARDVTGGVVVANGETLEVVYTPQITV